LKKNDQCGTGTSLYETSPNSDTPCHAEGAFKECLDGHQLFLETAHELGVPDYQ